MTTPCPNHALAVCLLGLFWRCLQQHSQITFRLAPDIGDDMGRVRFDGCEILLNPELDEGEVRATMAHELTHLERGPVPPAWSEQEEITVRMETARALMPDEAALQRLGRSFTETEIDVLTRLYGVDRDTAITAALAAQRPRRDVEV